MERDKNKIREANIAINDFLYYPQKIYNRHREYQSTVNWSGKDGKITWELEYYQIVANAFALACEELKINLRWGGSWKVNDFTLDPKNKFIDAVHFELIE